MSTKQTKCWKSDFAKEVHMPHPTCKYNSQSGGSFTPMKWFGSKNILRTGKRWLKLRDDDAGDIGVSFNCNKT